MAVPSLAKSVVNREHRGRIQKTQNMSGTTRYFIDAFGHVATDPKFFSEEGNC
jgi:hypothetical protein